MDFLSIRRQIPNEKVLSVHARDSSYVRAACEHLAPCIRTGKVNIKGGPIKEADWLKDPAGELNEDHSDNKNWITKWYGPDGNYENNGSFQVSGKIDLIDEGTNGKLTEPELSTVAGLESTQTIKMEWAKKHGGTRDWTVFELDPADAHHMNRDGPIDNIDTYAICVIDAPKDMTSVMSPAHDDHAQIWINGEKWYNNSRWTGAAQQVDFNIEVKLVKGANVVLYRCGESGGHAYMNCISTIKRIRRSISTHRKQRTRRASLMK